MKNARGLLASLLLLPAAMTLSRQEHDVSMLRAGTTISIKQNLSEDDIEASDRELSIMREEETAFCHGRTLCLWHSPISEHLKRNAAYSSSNFLRHVDSLPFEGFKLTRYQSQTQLAALVPVEKVSGGGDAFMEVKKLADSHRPIDCGGLYQNDPSGYIPDNVAKARAKILTVSAQTATGRAMESTNKSCLYVFHAVTNQNTKVFALCEVANINGVDGAPNQCIAVAHESNARQWLLAYVGSFEILLADLGRPSFGLNLALPATGESALQFQGKKGYDRLAQAAEKALSAHPLSLSTKIDRDVMGTADKRRSSVLQGWNESVTVRVEIRSDGTAHLGNQYLPLFRFIVSTDLLVNKQKDPEPLHWHQPDDVQNKIWNAAIKLRLKEEMNKLCAKPSWKDDYALECN